MKFNLRFLTANDVYKPTRFSSLKSMIPGYTLPNGVTKCVLPGDFLGGSLFSVSHEGKSMIEVCNEVGFDYVTLGNHEFDFGKDALEGLMDMSSFQWLGSNVRYTDTNNLFHKVLDYDVFMVPSSDCDNVDVNLKVGVFGICTQHTPQLSSPTDALVFEDVVEHSKRIVGHLRAVENCDLVIALTHVSLAEDKDVAEIGGIDLILGGHDHEPYIIEHQGILIMKCGQNLDYLGVVDLDITCEIFEGVKNISFHRSIQLISTHNIQGDPIIDSIIQKWKDLSVEGNGESDEPLTIVDRIGRVPLSTKTSECRSSENSFCCILADAYKFICAEEGLRCDFAIQNGGFVRGDTLYSPGSTITSSIIAEELPFTRFPVLLEMTGRAVIEGLNGMLPKTNPPSPVGSFPHLSEGITACYDLNAHANSENSKLFNVLVNGKGIDLDAVYRVATTSFYVFEPADGVTAFNNNKIIKQFDILCKEAMIKYLRTLDSVSGVSPGRLVNMTTASA